MYVAGNNKTYFGLHAKYLIFFYRFERNLWFLDRFSSRATTGHPSSGSHNDTCVQIDGHGTNSLCERL